MKRKHTYIMVLFGLLLAFVWWFWRFNLENQGDIKLSGDIMDANLYATKELDQKVSQWVKNQNKKSFNAFKSHPQFEELKNYYLNLMQAKDKILYARLNGDGFVYNFWMDEKYKKGLIQRTSLKNYLSGDFKWEEVLNLDALAEKEKENWVYKGGNFHPAGNRVLFFLSRGGKDASVIREFDLIRKKFVKGGFNFPESRSDAEWISKDEIAIATDWKTEDSFTDSQYPRILKAVKRGTPIADAVTLLKVEKTDVYVGSFILPSQDKGDRLIITRSKDHFSKEFFLRKENGELEKIPLPLHAFIHTSFQGNFVLKLDKSWKWKDQDYRAGSFLIVNPDKLIQEELSAVQLLMESSSEKVLNFAAASRTSIYISVLEDVKNSIIELKLHNNSWRKKVIPFPSSFSSGWLVDVDPRRSDVFLSYTSFLENNKLYHYNDVSGEFKKIQELPPRFKADSYKVEQFFAESFDKTKIPYFVVSQKNLKYNGENPTLLYAYGGFKSSLLPSYSPMKEFAWYRKGGVYVLANIRGGGEYGPQWHQAGLKENRQVIFNDFYAVAEDLIQRKITSPRYLGIQGASNGGLLMGVAITQRPELFNAALIKNPLLDMLNYHKMSIGSSWIAEYGNPDDPKMRKVISAYSPYQNLRLKEDYPEVFLITSTLDDRVPPEHARLFARKLEELNKPFYYYENSEGGHSSASNYEQTANLAALQYIYLYKKLME